MFHFFTHAFFKALLFLGAGVIIHTFDGEQDILKMGGLRQKRPLVFWTFLAGASSLAALPLVTAGFYSKDWILWHAWSSPMGHPVLWAAGAFGALLTGLYTFRVVFRVFFGTRSGPVPHAPGQWIKIPLVLLAIFSLAAGFFETPHSLGHVTVFSRFIGSTLPSLAGGSMGGSPGTEILLQSLAATLVLLGLLLAYALFLKKRALLDELSKSPVGARIHRFLSTGCGFDALYEFVIVAPFAGLVRFLKVDWVDSIYRGVGVTNQILHHVLSLTQNGLLRWYTTGIAAGAVILIALAVLL